MTALAASTLSAVSSKPELMLPVLKINSSRKSGRLTELPCKHFLSDLRILVRICFLLLLFLCLPLPLLELHVHAQASLYFHNGN